MQPAGKRLRPRNRSFASPRPDADKDGLHLLPSRQQDCNSCALKPQCTPILPARKLNLTFPLSAVGTSSRR